MHKNRDSQFGWEYICSCSGTRQRDRRLSNKRCCVIRLCSVPSAFCFSAQFVQLTSALESGTVRVRAHARLETDIGIVKIPPPQAPVPRPLSGHRAFSEVTWGVFLDPNCETQPYLIYVYNCS
jgi:hypothetical protein